MFFNWTLDLLAVAMIQLIDLQIYSNQFWVNFPKNETNFFSEVLSEVYECMRFVFSVETFLTNFLLADPTPEHNFLIPMIFAHNIKTIIICGFWRLLQEISNSK